MLLCERSDGVLLRGVGGVKGKGGSIAVKQSIATGGSFQAGEDIPSWSWSPTLVVPASSRPRRWCNLFVGADIERQAQRCVNRISDAEACLVHSILICWCDVAVMITRLLGTSLVCGPMRFWHKELSANRLPVSLSLSTVVDQRTKQEIYIYLEG